VSAPVLGWDVGGANLKAVQVRGGEPAGTVEDPFPLWREPQRLPERLAAIAARLGGARRMGVTMTAELADCFASKREGVASVLDAFGRAFPGAEVRVFGVDGRFRSPAEARRDPHAVAAANWAATAHALAARHPDALLVDVGSTTTDVIPVVGGRVAAAGLTDPARLRTGELVYTGALRTPVCATLRRVRLANGWTRVAAEHFAIAADAHLWLGRIPPAEYTCEPPDGRGTSRAEVAARLARVVCADPEMLAPGDLTRIARAVWSAQCRQITAAIRQVLRRLGPAAPRLALVAGRGGELAREAAHGAGLEVLPLDPEGALAAPAAAVALLLAEEPQGGA
jgi:probable H4MPT-linked C1 transfer pathway protein